MHSLNTVFLYGYHSVLFYQYDYFFDLLARFLLREPSVEQRTTLDPGFPHSAVITCK
jgi:hypothetical protein